MQEIATEVFTECYTFFDKQLDPAHSVGWGETLFNRDPTLRL